MSSQLPEPYALTARRRAASSSGDHIVSMTLDASSLRRTGSLPRFGRLPGGRGGGMPLRAPAAAPASSSPGRFLCERAAGSRGAPSSSKSSSSPPSSPMRAGGLDLRLEARTPPPPRASSARWRASRASCRWRRSVSVSVSRACLLRSEMTERTRCTPCAPSVTKPENSSAETVPSAPPGAAAVKSSPSSSKPPT